MRYTTNYDIGDRKRGQGINEDSLSVTIFEQGHREGYLGQTRPPRIRVRTDDEAVETDEAAPDSEGDEAAPDSEGDESEAEDGDAVDTDDEAGAEPADVAAAIDEAETDAAGRVAADDAGETVDNGDSDATDPTSEDADGADESEVERPDMPANRSAGVFVLADGAGGHDAGDVASYIATTVVAENLAPVAIHAARSHPDEFDIDISPDVLPEPLGPEDIQTGLENAIIKAHREIIRYASDSGTQSYTTVVAGVFADGRLHLGWVGDSRAYLVNEAREEIVRLTKDHAVVEEWEDQGEIDDVEAHVHPDGNQITRALGGSGHEDPDRAMVEVDTRSVRLFAEDTVLATSDGLIDAQTDAPRLYQEYVESDRSAEMAEAVLEAVVTDEEIRDVLLSADSLDDAATDYVTLANERGGKDNVSVLLFEDETLPSTPSGGVPVRAADPDVDLSERDTVIITED
ncbi:PP2C family protein-serine/threonine phosphatase [Haloarcula onubensis]|uniref:Protein phosphatase 2C domain-containing protein n=1 Tax=Haloarcula onubensis TaxID=2950539 RepID=A0ABU2FR07_9EURY|nr:protein phosphatase 2C domain-containing protein [Halomicroarcula sp. S3CR25-11]MDS0282844.1 protein phosphatase 2C domain-containing protein [Halomicroarcula sp. S3CR25-11]